MTIQIRNSSGFDTGTLQRESFALNSDHVPFVGDFEAVISQKSVNLKKFACSNRDLRGKNLPAHEEKS